MKDCVLCNINKDDIIHETKYSVSFIYINNIKLGHIAVATKRHINKLSGLTDAEVIDLFLHIQKLTKIIELKTNCEKVYLMYIGDKIDHYHIHLIPRNKDEAILGPYIFGDDGWKNRVYNKLIVKEKKKLIKFFQKKIRENNEEKKI